MNGNQKGNKTMAIINLNNGKLGAMFRNADKYAPHSSILPLFRIPDNNEKNASLWNRRRAKNCTDRSGL